MDGGINWEAHSIIPWVPGDISIRFGDKSGVLYGEIVNPSNGNILNVLRTPNFTTPDSMELMLAVPRRNGRFINRTWLEKRTKYISNLVDIADGKAGQPIAKDVTIAPLGSLLGTQQ
jgi:hypothetical protein